MDHVIQWVTASPLWASSSGTPALMRRPAILGFGNDDFMGDLLGKLQSDPASVAGLVAKPEVPAPGAPLTLYQPVHGRFYLVAATLVCRLPGLPHHAVDLAADEVASFVIRRLTPASKGPVQEMAWVPAASGKGMLWRKLSELGRNPASLAPGEAELPLSPIGFDDKGLKRRFLVGVVPIASRETFQAPVSATAEEGEGVVPRSELPADELDPVLAQLRRQVLLPGEALQEAPPAGESVAEASARVAREKEATDFVFLDLAELLQLRVPAVWSAVQADSDPGGDASDLFTFFATHALGATTWLQVLCDVWSRHDAIIAGTTEAPFTLRGSPFTATDLSDRFAKALPKSDPNAEAPAEPVEAPRFPARPGVRYVLRCLYRRPRCGALHQDVVSDASEPFEMASFFDTDAPARPIRIALPIDTSPAGLRKFKRGVGFVLSDQLRKQICQVADLKKTLKGESNECDDAGAGIGEICTLSIPIITLCATIVLMIFLSLLNLIFWWLPFIKVCFPIKLKAP